MKKRSYILQNHKKEESDIRVEASLEIEALEIKINFKILGNIKKYQFPKKEKQQRANELWRETCFELFFTIENDSDKYYEINISPTSKWNVYHFDSYREGISEVANILPPSIKIIKERDSIEFSVRIQFLRKEVLNQIDTFNLATILLDHYEVRHFYTIQKREGSVDFHDRANWKTKN